jgi:transposase-like protein
MTKPKTLRDAIRYFSDEQVCIDTIAKLRWPKGPVCPKCDHPDHYYLATQRRWKCKGCGRQFSVKVGTIFEDSPIALDKWLIALWMLVNCKNGVSSYEIARDLGMTQKSAWFVLHRLRLALKNRSLLMLGGKKKEVEADETFMGAKGRNMHQNVRLRRNINTGKADKAAVFGLLERGGEVRAMVVPTRRKPMLQGEIVKHVKSDTYLATDALPSYSGLNYRFIHESVDHAQGYVSGRAHTNGLENFWSLLKRSVKGTYVSVEPYHLQRYLDEQVFRYNNRKLANDGRRFENALAQIGGKRLTYAEVTGKDGKISAN